MGSTTIKLMLITLISKFSGLLREMVFGAVFGTGVIKDAYVISESTASVLFGFLFLAVQSCFIPVYNRIKAESGRKVADDFTANMTNTMLLVTTVIVAFGVIFAEPIVHIMAAGYTGERFAWTVLFTRIEMFSLYFVAANCCMISYLNIHGNFGTPALTGIILNILLIGSSILAAKLNQMILLAVGSLVATGLQYVFFPRAARKAGYRHKFKLDLKDPNIRIVLGMAVPIMLGIVVQDISIIIDKTVASAVATDGGVSALDYGVKLYQLVYGIIIVSIVTAVYPRMSELGQNHQIAALKGLTSSSIVSGLALVIPATVGMMIFSVPIVRLFFQRGAFTAESTMMTAGALFWYSPMLIALVFSTLGTRAFYSVGDSRTPVRITIVQVVTNVVFNLILSRFFGINGLAGATSIASWINAILTIYFLRRKVGRLKLRSVLHSTIKICAVTAVMAVFAVFLYNLVAPIHWVFALFFSVFFAIILYVILLLLLKIPEITVLTDALKNRYMRRKNA